jgi:hypothetical protein
MNSKVGILAKQAPQIWDSKEALKQLNLSKLSDGGGTKDADAGTAKSHLLSLFVYEPIPLNLS